MASVTVTHWGKTVTLNQSVGMAFGQLSRIKKEWRENFGWLGVAQRVKLLPPVEIHCRIEQSKRGGVGDAMGHAHVIKAAIDGLVDAKIIPNDDPAVVLRTICYAPTRGAETVAGHIGLTLQVVEVES